jgi:hypothetical protein
VVPFFVSPSFAIFLNRSKRRAYSA